MSELPLNPISEAQGLRRIHFTILLSMLTAFGPLCTDMYLPALPAISADLSIPASYVQASITACLLGLAMGQIVMGPISDGRGRKGILLFSLLVFTVSSALLATTHSGESFLALRFCQGLGGAGGTVLARAICADTYHGTKLTQFIALLMAIHGFAPILGPMLGGFLTVQWGWQAIFWLLTATGVLLLAGSCTLPETLPQERRVQGGILHSLRHMGRLFHLKAYMCLVGVQGFTMGGFFAYVAASPFIFQNIYGFSPEQYSMLFGLNAVGFVCSSMAAGPLSRRLGDRRMLLFGDCLRSVACVGVLVVCLVLPASPFIMVAALFCMLVMQGPTMTASFTLAISAQNVGAGAASGILGVAVFIGGSVTSPLVGLCGAQSAVPLGIVVCLTGSCSLLLSILGTRALRREKARTISDVLKGQEQCGQK